MADPDTKAKHQKTRRNYIAKELLSDKRYKKKIHMSKKDRDKQRKWRLSEDPDSIYEELDAWLLKQERDNDT